MVESDVTIAEVNAKLDRLIEQIDQPAKRFLTIAGAAGYTSLSVESIRRAIARQDLEPLRAVRGKILLDRFQIDQWVLASANRRLVGGRGSWVQKNAERGCLRTPRPAKGEVYDDNSSK